MGASFLPDLPDLLGAAGGLLIVLAYLLLQLGRMDPRSLAYSAQNAVGAGLILLSLASDFNLGAVLVESFWLLVSAFGIARCLRHAGRPPATAHADGQRGNSRPRGTMGNMGTGGTGGTEGTGGRGEP